MASPLIKDYQWVRQSFLVKADMLDKIEQQNRFFSTASLKFTDTTIGGNFCINPPPQFTRTADPKCRSRYNASKGMGRYYSEAIDDNSQVIHMRFGVPQFNSLTTFFTGFYNTGAGRLARTGRAGGFFYSLGRVAGFVVAIASWPIFLAVYGTQAAGLAYRFAMGKPASKFYYMKPTMALYWNAVTTIVNHIATNKGIVPRIFESEANTKLGIGLSEADRKTYAKMMPGIIDENGGVDVYKIANRAQRLARQHYKNMEAALNKENGDIASAIKSVFNMNLSDENKPTLKSYLEKWLANQQSDDTKSKEAVEALPDYNPDVKEDDGLMALVKAELDDGSMFASFRVNYTGSVSESFSNSVTDSEIANNFNSMSSQSRSTSFNFAGGNISELIGGAVNGVKDFVAGMADQFSVQGLGALAGAAFVDIPKHWQSSMASLPRSTYTMTLNAPYGNPMSRFLSQDIPLAMLLGGALPLSTGKQSYTSPFLVELYDKGRCQVRLGMIDSLSVTRGTGNLGFTNEGQCLSMEVSFSIIDMSTIMHMPISEGFSFSYDTAFFDEDTTFTDYMAVLAGMDLADQVYSWRKLKINITRQMKHWDSFFSVSHFVSWAGDTGPARLASAFFKGTAR